MKIQDLIHHQGTIIIYIYLLRFNNTDQSLSELLVVINMQPRNYLGHEMDSFVSRIILKRDSLKI